MKKTLDGRELADLVRTVFRITPDDRRLAILVDVPDKTKPDNPQWERRRVLASEWAASLSRVKDSLGLESVDLYLYPNVHSNNADLPLLAYGPAEGLQNADAEALPRTGEGIPFKTVLSEHTLVLAPTEFSTTAPLKVLARSLGFRAATMPGFSEAMVDALRLDWAKINARVERLRDLLDPAEGAEILFSVDGKEVFRLFMDLRFRTSHVSGGLIPHSGTAANLPSGECYIVPYEGEKKGERSRTRGTLPVQFEKEVVLYRIEENRAAGVDSRGPFSESEAAQIRKEPAYANLAELGFGVLADFGIRPVGEILLDEKLGLHIAFGRSDHFGGSVGPTAFRSPETVVHIDRIFIPQIQDRIRVDSVVLEGPGTIRTQIMKNGRYTIFD
jgi:hypothetical protein